MEHTQNIFITLIALILCACVTVALPAGGRSSGDVLQGDLSHLVKLIGKLKSLNSQHSANAAGAGTAADTWAVLGSDDDSASSQALAPSVGSASDADDKLAALKHGFLGFNKRQGAWSYDYGLGGGRFGKRYYGDYGIGGGRFGRDVDHVDIADANDAAL